MLCKVSYLYNLFLFGWTDRGAGDYVFQLTMKLEKATREGFV
jgi:hypothetical protein